MTPVRACYAVRVHALQPDSATPVFVRVGMRACACLCVCVQFAPAATKLRRPWVYMCVWVCVGV